MSLKFSATFSILIACSDQGAILESKLGCIQKAYAFKPLIMITRLEFLRSTWVHRVTLCGFKVQMCRHIDIVVPHWGQLGVS